MWQVPLIPWSVWVQGRKLCQRVVVIDLFIPSQNRFLLKQGSIAYLTSNLFGTCINDNFISEIARVLARQISVTDLFGGHLMTVISLSICGSFNSAWVAVKLVRAETRLLMHKSFFGHQVICLIIHFRGFLFTERFIFLKIHFELFLYIFIAFRGAFASLANFLICGHETFGRLQRRFIGLLFLDCGNCLLFRVVSIHVVSKPKLFLKFIARDELYWLLLLPIWIVFTDFFVFLVTFLRLFSGLSRLETKLFRCGLIIDVVLMLPEKGHFYWFGRGNRSFEGSRLVLYQIVRHWFSPLGLLKCVKGQEVGFGSFWKTSVFRDSYHSLKPSWIWI